ncbi:8531_t:CDS:2 [Rhizophagus irregularis]|nr:8531_t:CDS:2 [Rhizophagus irregularis]
MHRVRTKTNKFTTGRIRNTKKTKPQFVQRDTRVANIFQNNLRVNVESQHNSETDDTDTFQWNNGKEYISNIENISEPLENTDVNAELSDTNVNTVYDYSSSLNGQCFPNISVFLIFIWTVKHIIGTAAYKDLINILKHPQFCIFDLPNDLSTVKKYRNKLPLMPISSLTVPILQKNTPSNSEATKEATGEFVMYEFDNVRYYGRILAFIQVEENGSWRIKIQKLLNYFDLPRIFRSASRDRGLHNHIQINGKIKSLFDGWYLTSQVYSNEDIEEDQENNFTSPSSNYINIKVRSKWNKQKIQENGFSGRKLDENMVSDISWTYDNYFGQQAAVAHYNINFYQHLSFTIIDDDMIIEENIKLQAGDVVEIEGKEDNDDIENEKWFARIQAIFVH